LDSTGKGDVKEVVSKALEDTNDVELVHSNWFGFFDIDHDLLWSSHARVLVQKRTELVFRTLACGLEEAAGLVVLDCLEAKERFLAVDGLREPVQVVVIVRELVVNGVQGFEMEDLDRKEVGVKIEEALALLLVFNDKFELVCRLKGIFQVRDLFLSPLRGRQAMETTVKGSCRQTAELLI